MTEKESFNQNKYIQQWKKENMSSVIGSYKKDFVLEFKTACKKLGITQSEVIKEAMQKTINEAKEIAE